MSEVAPQAGAGAGLVFVIPVGYIWAMSLAEIKHAIEELSQEQRAALADWLWNHERKDWDRQITEDFSPGGRGAKLLDEVDSAIERGEFKPME